MAFIREYKRKAKVKDTDTGKIIDREYIYYSIVENYRKNGKVCQRRLQHIGSLDKLKEFAVLSYKRGVEESEKKANLDGVSFIAYSHGAGMALFWIAEQIGLEDIINEVIEPKMIKGIPRSRILLLAAIHQAIDPGSKREFAAWVRTTSLPYHLQFDPEDLTSQTFWRAMDGISIEQIQTMWHLLVARIMKEFGIQLSVLPLDYSNYFTFIDSRNGRCVICKRGHNKQKRDDLRQFSLAATTLYDLRIPIIWSLYQGNKNDKSEFPEFVKFVKEELVKFGADLNEITLSFDGGSNSEENFKDIGLHILCAHSLVSFPEYYDIPLSKFKEITLANGSKRLAHKIESMTFSGVKGTGVLTYSEDLMTGQLADLEKKLQASADAVADVRNRLANPRSRLWTVLKKRQTETEAAKSKAEEYNAKITEDQKSGKKNRGKPKKLKDVPVWDPVPVMKEIIEDVVYAGRKVLRDFTKVSVRLDSNGTYAVEWEVYEEAKTKYCNKYFGKKLTCTDHTEWSASEILQEYSNQECIENGVFKISKNTDHFSIRPQYHWTDDKIWTHVSLCLVAIALAEVLRKRLDAEGTVITRPQLMDSLAKIQEGWLLQDDRKVRRTMAGIEDENLAALWNTVLKVCGK